MKAPVLWQLLQWRPFCTIFPCLQWLDGAQAPGSLHLPEVAQATVRMSTIRSAL